MKVLKSASICMSSMAASQLQLYPQWSGGKSSCGGRRRGGGEGYGEPLALRYVSTSKMVVVYILCKDLTVDRRLAKGLPPFV